MRNERRKKELKFILFADGAITKDTVNTFLHKLYCFTL